MTTSADELSQGGGDPAAEASLQRDIVVIGGSAGGLEALNHIVTRLPEDLPAAVFVVLHISPVARSSLPAILARRTLLRTGAAADGDRIERGRIYVAPPDRHVLIEEGGHVRLSRGPRENGNRPAIDPLFRTAARAYGPRVIGIVLSGALSDGTLGLKVVNGHGGVTIVQHPGDALYPSMPENAITEADPDHVLPAAEIGRLITELASASAPVSITKRFVAEAYPFDEMKLDTEHLSCPECGGPLTEVGESRVPRYVCRVGHSFSTESLFAEQADELESALWTAIRVLEERSDLAVRLAERLEQRGSDLAAQRFRASADDAKRQADVVRQLVEEFDAAADVGPDEAEVASAAKARTAARRE